MYSLFRIKDYICIVILGLIKKLYSYFRTSHISGILRGYFGDTSGIKAGWFVVKSLCFRDLFYKIKQLFNYFIEVKLMILSVLKYF